MFARTVKADHSTPGFKWKGTGRGSIKGRLYSTLSMRSKLSPGKAAALSFLVTLFKADTSLPDDQFLADTFAIFIVGWILFFAFLLIWPFSKTIEFSATHFRVGGKKYNIEDVGNFRTITAKNAKPHSDREQITFSYGRKDIRLRPINDFKTTFRIAETFNSMKQAALNLAEDAPSQAAEGSDEENEALDRAAGF